MEFVEDPDARRRRSFTHSEFNLVASFFSLVFNFILVAVALSFVITALGFIFKLNHVYEKAALGVDGMRKQAYGTLALAHCKNHFGTLTQRERDAHPYVERVETRDCDASQVIINGDERYQLLYAISGELGICEVSQCAGLVGMAFARLESFMWFGVPTFLLIALVAWMLGAFSRGSGGALPMHHYGQQPIILMTGEQTRLLQQRMLSYDDSRRERRYEDMYNKEKVY